MNALRPDLQALLQHEAATQAREDNRTRHRRRRRTFAGAGTFALAATAAALFLTASPSGAPLSVTEAVAAASEQLEDSGVLYWVQRTDFAPGDSLDATGSASAVVRRWTDLDTGDSRTEQEILRPGQAPEKTQFGSQDGNPWFAPGGDIPVQHLPNETATPTKPNDFSPIDDVADVRATLKRGEQGLAELAEAPDENGTRVVTVTDRPQDGVVVKTWITRAEQPQVLRIATTTDGPTGAPVTQTATTTEWSILPASVTTRELAYPPK